MSILATVRPSEEREAGLWVCRRCGFKLFNGKPQKDRLCESCRESENESLDAAPKRYREIVSRVPGVEKKCKAWRLDFDDDDNPITPEGEYVLPGERVCGHRDCVEPTHIIEEEARVA